VKPDKKILIWPRTGITKQGCTYILGRLIQPLEEGNKAGDRSGPAAGRSEGHDISYVCAKRLFLIGLASSLTLLFRSRVKPSDQNHYGPSLKGYGQIYYEFPDKHT
jgi:hypothetical protein